MFAIAGMMRFGPDHDEVVAVMADLNRASRGDAGCIAYWFAEDVGDPGTFRFFECWEDDEVFAAHCATPHYLDFNERFLPKLIGVEATRFEISGTTPLA